MQMKRQDESGAAMITALLFVIIMTFLITSISITAISGLQKSKAAQEATGLSIVIDSALSNATSFANNPMPGKDLEQRVGLANAQYGISTFANANASSGEGKYKWLWYTERVKDAVVGESYDIIAIAYVNAPTDLNSRKVRVRLQAIPVTFAKYEETGYVTYAPIPTGAFNWGILGTNGVNVASGASVKSYNSAAVSDPVNANNTNNGSVSSNENISIAGTDVNSVKRVVMLRGNADDMPIDRCTTTANCKGKMVSFAYAIGLESISEKVRKECPLAATAYPNWTASTYSGEINPEEDGKCFNNISFNAKSDVANGYSSGNPAEIYALGNISVTAGVSVNQNAARGGPLALRVYSAAGTSATLSSGTDSAPTKFAGLIAGVNLDCKTSETGIFIYKGSMACHKINLGTGTTVWWDQQTVQVLGAGKDRTINTIWSLASYSPEYN